MSVIWCARWRPATDRAAALRTDWRRLTRQAGRPAKVATSVAIIQSWQYEGNNESLIHNCWNELPDTVQLAQNGKATSNTLLSMCTHVEVDISKNAKVTHCYPRGKSGLTDMVCYKRLLYMVGFLRPSATTSGWTTFSIGYCNSEIQDGVQDGRRNLKSP